MANQVAREIDREVINNLYQQNAQNVAFLRDERQMIADDMAVRGHHNRLDAIMRDIETDIQRLEDNNANLNNNPRRYNIF